MEPKFVFMFILILLIGIFYAYAYTKEKKLYYLISAVLLLLDPCLVGIGMWEHSQKLVEVGFVSPFSLFLMRIPPISLTNAAPSGIIISETQYHSRKKRY